MAKYFRATSIFSSPLYRLVSFRLPSLGNHILFLDRNVTSAIAPLLLQRFPHGIYLENIELYDRNRIREMTKCDNFNHKISPLNLAIAVPCEGKMVRYLLEKDDGDPTVRDASGRNALEMATMYAEHAGIRFNLGKSNGENGRTR
jgi:hypothetical protein